MSLGRLLVPTVFVLASVLRCSCPPPDVDPSPSPSVPPPPQDSPNTAAVSCSDVVVTPSENGREISITSPPQASCECIRLRVECEGVCLENWDVGFRLENSDSSPMDERLYWCNHTIDIRNESFVGCLFSIVYADKSIENLCIDFSKNPAVVVCDILLDSGSGMDHATTSIADTPLSPTPTPTGHTAGTSHGLPPTDTSASTSNVMMMVVKIVLPTVGVLLIVFLVVLVICICRYCKSRAKKKAAASRRLHESYISKQEDQDIFRDNAMPSRQEKPLQRTREAPIMRGLDPDEQEPDDMEYAMLSSRPEEQDSYLEFTEPGSRPEEQEFFMGFAESIPEEQDPYMDSAMPIPEEQEPYMDSAMPMNSGFALPPMGAEAEVDRPKPRLRKRPKPEEVRRSPSPSAYYPREDTGSDSDSNDHVPLIPNRTAYQGKRL